MSILTASENTTAQRVHITEPSLNVVFDVNGYVTEAILIQHGTSFPQWETDSIKLEEFEVRVRTRGSDLQHERVVTPKMPVLEQEREKFLTEYWEFKATCATVEQFGLNLFKAIDYLTPRTRLDAEELNLVDSAPQLSAQIKAIDEISLSQMSKLKEAHTQVSGLHEKMTTFISSKVNWSVQRFCQIVDNNGKPISGWTRLVDNVTYPVVPKPASMSLDSAALTEVKTNAIEKDKTV